MKFTISESQLRKIVEDFIKSDESGEEIRKNFMDGEHYNWFDIPPQISKERFKVGMSMTISHLSKQYNIRKVLYTDTEGSVVGFLLYAVSNPNKESQGTLEDKTDYPVLLSTAIRPDFRGSGGLKSMLDKAEITKPFIVHTSQISPTQLWKKFGCSPIYEYPSPHKGNFVELCK